MQILTRNEATHRAATLEVSSIDVTVDVSGAADSSQETYPVTSVLTLTAREERTFIDIVGQVRAVLLNGAEHPFEDDEDRVWVSGLPVGESFTLEVRALAHYSRSGEGLHRYTDPEDGGAITWKVHSGLTSGWSMHGQARCASLGSNWVYRYTSPSSGSV